jgi:hypothetical protein
MKYAEDRGDQVPQNELFLVTYDIYPTHATHASIYNLIVTSRVVTSNLRSYPISNYNAVTLPSCGKPRHHHAVNTQK